MDQKLAEIFVARGIAHVRGAPCHPQTQGKIERWHQTLKNRILLENYYLPVISLPRSRPSSSTTITGVTMKAYRTSHRPTSTSAEAEPSFWNEKGSNATPSDSDDCNIS